MGIFGGKNKADIVNEEEKAIHNLIVDLLKKENTRVLMAPISKKYFITNKDIELNILVDGSAELVKTSNHKFKYGWKFRGAFINQLIDVVIDWIEADRAKIEKEIFINEVNLLGDIGKLVNSLPDRKEYEIS